MKQNAFDFEADPLQSSFEAHLREFTDRLLADIRHHDLETLVAAGERTSGSARCFHDVVELLIEKLPPHEAAVYSQTCWYLLRILFVAFEEKLTGLLPHDDVVEAQTQAAIKNFVRDIRKPSPDEEN